LYKQQHKGLESSGVDELQLTNVMLLQGHSQVSSLGHPALTVTYELALYVAVQYKAPCKFESLFVCMVVNHLTYKSKEHDCFCKIADLLFFSSLRREGHGHSRTSPPGYAPELQDNNKVNG